MMPEKNPNTKPIETPEFDIRRYVLDMAMDLKLLLVLVLATLVFIYVPYLNDTPIRSAFGLAMVLFLPGYSLIAALFPGKRDLGRVERAALSFGLSIAVSSLIGLGLNWTFLGIRLDPLATSLSLFTIVGLAIANKRRHDLPANERILVDLKSVRQAVHEEVSPPSASRMDRALNMVLIAVILISVALTIFVLAVPKHGEKFTEFYILGPDGKTENYPLEFLPGVNNPIAVGIVNHEYQNVTYDLVARINDNGTIIDTLYSNRISLSNEQSWNQIINLTTNQTGGTYLMLQFLLYKDGNLTAPYRDLHLWVNVTSPEI
jgi:uncharacterized membrane protein